MLLAQSRWCSAAWTRTSGSGFAARTQSSSAPSGAPGRSGCPPRRSSCRLRTRPLPRRARAAIATPDERAPYARDRRRLPGTTSESLDQPPRAFASRGKSALSDRSIRATETGAPERRQKPSGRPGPLLRSDREAVPGSRRRIARARGSPRSAGRRRAPAPRPSPSSPLGRNPARWKVIRRADLSGVAQAAATRGPTRWAGARPGASASTCRAGGLGVEAGVHAEVEQSDKIETTFELPFGQDVIFYCQVGSCRWRRGAPRRRPIIRAERSRPRPHPDG
jgi:hypothetical protein